MALTQAYLTSVKNLPAMLSAIQEAGVPDKFTYEFLKTLGFGSSNDRTLIPVLKGIDFLDASAQPTIRYRQYKDRSKAAAVMADAIRDAYEDVFLAFENAHSASLDKIKGVFATKTGKGDAVVEKMATTFKALCSLGDFSGPRSQREEKKAELVTEESESKPAKVEPHSTQRNRPPEPMFHYNIQIHLPATRDISVYNAIFKSLKEHLLS